MTRLILVPSFFLALTGLAGQAEAQEFEQRLAGVTEMTLGAAEVGGGAWLLMLDRTQESGPPRLALGAAIPMIALGAADVVTGIVDTARAGEGGVSADRIAERVRRTRMARLTLLLGGGTVASFGGFFDSNLAIGAGLSVLTHSVMRLVLDHVTLGRVRPVDVGLSVIPENGRTTAIATVTGSL